MKNLFPLLILILAFSAQTFAVDFTVNLPTDPRDASLADGVCDIDLATAGLQCSLRAAVEQANNLGSNDRILFNLPLNSTVTLTTANGGEIPIVNNGILEIIGTGANILTIDGGAGTNRIFFTNLTTVTISGVTLTGGNSTGTTSSGFGGAILDSGGSLTLDSVHMTGNTASTAGGGVSFDSGTYRIINSTISGNNALDCGGFVTESSTLTVVNSTFSGNRATTGDGGGFCNNRSATTLRNVTITNNTSNLGGGGISTGLSIGLSSTLNFGNTIVAGNTATINSGPEIRFNGGFITSAGGNLVGDSPGDSTNTGPNAIAYQPTDIRDVNPLLGALQNNGGTTPTHRLLGGSPAIDKGSNSLAYDPFNNTPLVYDQRALGFPRMVDGNGDDVPTVDIGAYEVQILNCTYSISPNNAQLSAGGGNTTVNVTSIIGCGWTAASNVSWISVTMGNTGNGNGTVSLAVQLNTGIARTGTVSIAGQTFTITQASGCTYTLTPTSTNISTGGGTGSFNITSGTGCNWTAVSNAPWITVTSGSSGIGNGTVSFSVQANSGPPRTGTITAGGQTFTVNQANSCTYSLSATNANFGETGGNGSVNVITQAGCIWSALSNSPWITVTAGGSGTGNGTVSFSVAANTGPTRTGTITVAGQTFTVTQTSGCTYTLSSNGTAFAAAGGSGSFNVIANPGCVWTAVSNSPWLIINSGTPGSGNGAVSFTVQANVGPARTGTITVGGQTFTVTQANGCSFSIFPANLNVGASAGTGNFNINTGAGCAWTAVSNASWITVTAGSNGSGSGTVTFSWTANPGPTRTGTITAGGQTFTITQTALQTLSINNVMLNEGNSGTTAFTFTVSLSAADNQPISVNFATANGTATAPEDYTAASGTLTFAAGEVNKTLTILVNGDTLVEPNETFTVNLSNPNNAVIAIGQGTGTILNDDTGGSLQFSASNYTVNENQATATISVTKIGGNASGVSINYATSNGTATAGLDYLATSGTLFFAADETTRTFSIPIINDLIDEANETVNIILSNPGGGGTLGSPVAAVLTIIDDDNAPSVSISNVSMNEGNTGTTAFNLTVSLLGASSQTVTVNFATANGTATAPVDYQPVSGSLSFAPGETSKTITVLVNGDTEVEVNETFTVNLSGATNATISNGQGTATILNDDTCEYSISPTSINIPASGSSDNIIFLTSKTECQWNAVSNDSWITITRGNSGTGSGTVLFSVAANTGPTRTGTITVAGQTFTVTQTSGCTYTLSSNGTAFSAAAGSGSFNVIANPGCVWTAVSNSPWLTILSNPNGNGNNEVFFTVQANTGEARTGRISVNGQTFTVTQANGCSFSIFPANLNIGASAGTGNFNINTGAGCTWTAVSNASWITISAGGSGTGNGTVSFSVAANTGPARTGTITVGGQTFTVTQASGCSFSIFPANLNVGASAGTGNFSLNTGAGCTWTAVSNASWITVTAGSNGSGSGTVTFSWTANPGPTRTGAITAGGQTFTITQADGATTLVRTLFDFDGDGKADVSVFRPSNGGWYIDQSMNGFTGIAFGQAGDRIVPADYDGDGKTDVAVYRGGTWYLNRSLAGFTAIDFGTAEDIPQPADFDNDGKAELAVFRPSNGYWYVLNLVTNQFTAVQFGQTGDRPVVADYDGDGRADYAVYRDGGWYILRSSQGFIGIQFGEAADRPVPADYDGDGKADIAVFRPSNGTWYLNGSTAGFAGIQFGISTDVPAAADYDGDGRADIAVFRDGVWYLQRSAAGFTGVQFGAATDKPVPNAFVP